MIDSRRERLDALVGALLFTFVLVLWFEWGTYFVYEEWQRLNPRW